MSEGYPGLTRLTHDWYEFAWHGRVPAMVVSVLQGVFSSMSFSKMVLNLARIPVGGVLVLSMALIGVNTPWATAQETSLAGVSSSTQSLSIQSVPSPSHTTLGHEESHGQTAHEHPIPGLLWITPFVILLLCIAILPLIPATHHWWEHNSSKLVVALVLSVVTIAYYWLRGYGFPHADHALEPGFPSVLGMLHHAVIADYIPFIVLLLSLFVISGGISVTGDVPAHPPTNTLILALGGLLASFIGTTGAAMLLIRPLLQINQERQRVVHTVVFFIFIVCNIGGSLLPVGDPPLFLGYLRGVPFLWTFNLVVEWAFCLGILLAVYYVWDEWAWRHEKKEALDLDETIKEPIRIRGSINFLFLLGVVLAVGLLVPGKTLFGWTVPHLTPIGLREMVQLVLAGISLLVTAREVRQANNFNFTAIGEVACLFIGIFITMQVPIEILNAEGARMGLTSEAHFFWATGILSSFLDNAPTYVVFFQTAGTLNWSNPAELMHGVQTATGSIPIPLLIAVSLGSVFMGANTYIGNGPNFMVKSIAENAGVKMPSFFGYMLYSVAILIPLFVLVTWVFMV